MTLVRGLRGRNVVEEAPRFGEGTSRATRVGCGHFPANGSRTAPLLGHSHIATTILYLHLTEPTRTSIANLLDKLMVDLGP